MAVLPIGILGLLFSMLVPGLCILQLFPVKVSPYGKVALACGLSLTINHLIVLLLVAADLYHRSVIMIIVAAECLYLILSKHLALNFKISDLKYRDQTSNRPIFTEIVFIILILSYAVIATRDFGNIFTTWDAVVSWNKWAVEWMSGRLPIQTFEYPQLLPTTWSLIYIVLGSSELEVFPKAMAAWLPIASILAFADLAFTGSAIAATSAAGFLLVLLNLFGDFGRSGYADLPSGVMSFLAFFAATRAANDDSSGNRLALLGAVIAGGAALTKQSGAFFAALYPVFLFFLSPAGHKAARAARASLVILAVCAPWYLYRLYAIRWGGELSNIAFTMSTIHAGRSLLERFVHGGGLIREALGGVALYSVSAVLAVSLLCRLGRTVFLTSVAPYLLVYLLFFSYDIRNCVPIVPFVAWLMGIGAAQMLDIFSTRCLSSRRPYKYDSLPNWVLIRSLPIETRHLVSAFAFSVGIGAVSYFGKWPTKEDVLADQNRRLMSLGNPEVNRTVVGFIESQRPSGRILTNDYLLWAIPVIRPYFLAFLMGSWTSEETLSYVISSESVSAVLATDGAAAHLASTIERWKAQGRIEVVAGSPDKWILFEVRSPLQ